MFKTFYYISSKIYLFNQLLISKLSLALTSDTAWILFLHIFLFNYFPYFVHPKITLNNQSCQSHLSIIHPVLPSKIYFRIVYILLIISWQSVSLVYNNLQAFSKVLGDRICVYIFSLHLTYNYGCSRQSLFKLFRPHSWKFFVCWIKNI